MATPPQASHAKGRYERPAPLALASVKAEATASRTSLASPATPASSRAQFEGQEDFISFDASPPPPAPRFIPKKQRDSAVSKRKLDEFEERTEEKNERVKRRERERTTPWCVDPGVDWAACQSATAMLNAEARAFITYISPTPVEHQLRMWTVELIRRTIQQRWPEADVTCFGSVGTGLYLPGGDIDLVVLCPLFPSPPLKPTSSLLHSLASLLLTSSLAEPSSLLVIAKARVPIVKFTTRYGGFAVDLSVNQGGGVDAAMKVRKLLEDHAHRDAGWVEPGRGEVDAGLVDHGVARSLVMLVKAFLNQRGMNEVFTGGLGSYSIICLVVSFLQLHPKIQTGAIHPARNIGLLFAEFLEYYGKHFNFDEAGITLRGRGGYFNKHDKGWFRPNQPYLLSIEDPNDPLNDVSGGSHNILRVRQTLAGAFDVLSATLLHRVSHFSSAALHPLSSDSLPNSDYASSSNPRAQSILGSIIGMSKLGIKSRLANVALFDEGILQSLLPDKEKTSGSKKAVKKLWKAEKESKKSMRTLARLETRMKEREEKMVRKEAKKAGSIASIPILEEDGDLPAAPFASEIAEARTLTDSESRYSLAARASAPAAIVYVGSDSSEDSEDEAEDMRMGGTGGIL